MASLAAQSHTNRRPSPLLSNNPFRNRNDPPSPALPSPAISNRSTGDRPVSLNPFFDFTDFRPQPPVQTMAPQPTRPYVGENTRELLENMTISDAPKKQAARPPNDPGGRSENLPPRSQHGPSQLEERRRHAAGTSHATGEADIFADPSDRPRERRPRRNSDTSVREKTSRHLDHNDDKRRRERRHRDTKRDVHSKAPSRKLDVIDKLDVTSIYGTGLFHHDGPFDACNPHRNRKGTRAAPMQAFPKNSRNMALGGSGPNNSNIDLAQFHGRGEEGYNDYSNSAAVDEDQGPKRPVAPRSTSFHPVARCEPVHGEESMGLGTSTFLEGAPASRTAMHRRQSDLEETGQPGGVGLGRKKSLAMKIKGISNHRAGGGGNAVRPGSADKARSPTTPLATSRSDYDTTSNSPFFKDYDREYEKGAQISFAEGGQGRARAPSSPKTAFPLERRATSDSVGEETRGGGGFLSRVRSLKGGSRKPRGERREAS